LKTRTAFPRSICLFTAFVLWTIVTMHVDVRAIGPNGSCVGLAALNGYFHNLTGVHLVLYAITDWLGLVPVAFCLAFAVFGLVQWIHRRHILRVDYSLLVLGGFYLLMLAAYLFFEHFVVNYRPVLINGILEASYPSSTTLLVLCVMVTALLQLRLRIQRRFWKCCTTVFIVSFLIFMVAARLLSGVHWLSDIVGGILLSGALVSLYESVCQLKK